MSYEVARKRALRNVILAQARIRSHFQRMFASANMTNHIPILKLFNRGNAAL